MNNIIAAEDEMHAMALTSSLICNETFNPYAALHAIKRIQNPFGRVANKLRYIASTLYRVEFALGNTVSNMMEDIRRSLTRISLTGLSLFFSPQTLLLVPNDIPFYIHQALSLLNARHPEHFRAVDLIALIDLYHAAYAKVKSQIAHLELLLWNRFLGPEDTYYDFEKIFANSTTFKTMSFATSMFDSPHVNYSKKIVIVSPKTACFPRDGLDDVPGDGNRRSGKSSGKPVCAALFLQRLRQWEYYLLSERTRNVINAALAEDCEGGMGRVRGNSWAVEKSMSKNIGMKGIRSYGNRGYLRYFFVEETMDGNEESCAGGSGLRRSKADVGWRCTRLVEIKNMPCSVIFGTLAEKNRNV
ncbi:hypothetical protein MMC25_000192 [Agyrium rufum]|nr:hypothetical protein [Agyrium rufum]